MICPSVAPQMVVAVALSAPLAPEAVNVTVLLLAPVHETLPVGSVVSPVNDPKESAKAPDAPVSVPANVALWSDPSVRAVVCVPPEVVVCNVIDVAPPPPPVLIVSDVPPWLVMVPTLLSVP